MNREKTIIRTSIIGIIGNIFLTTVKAIIGFFVNSIAIILDAVNNLSDALSSIITIIGTKLASKKPDEKHPFGYGRIEHITSITIGVIIFAAGITALKEAITSIITGDKADYSLLSIIILVIGVIVKIFLGLYFKYYGKKIKSSSLKASGTDALFDAIISTTTIIAAVISLLFKINIEGYLGIIISFFIFKAAIEILKDGLSDIIGVKADSDTAHNLKEDILSFDKVKGVYDLILNDYGTNKTIGSVHIEVDDNLTAKEIHPLTNEIASLIYEKYHIIMTVGIYSSSNSDEIGLNIKHTIINLIKNYPNIKQFHGFYLNHEDKICNFDLVISFKEKDPLSVINNIKNELCTLYPDYEFYIVHDQIYS